MNSNNLNPLITSIEQAMEEIILKSITNEEVKQLTTNTFPCNLKKEDVNSYFYRALDVFHPNLIHYLITTEKNQVKFNFKDSMPIIENVFHSYAAYIALDSSKHTDSLAFLLKYEQFTSNISEKMAKSLVKIALYHNNEKLINFAIKKPEWSQYFQQNNCFQKASRHGNTQLLETLFANNDLYSTLSKESLIQNCVFESIDKKNYDLLFYILYEKNIELTDSIHKLCSKHVKSKDMLEQYINFKNLENTIGANNIGKTKAKKKI